MPSRFLLHSLPFLYRQVLSILFPFGGAATVEQEPKFAALFPLSSVFYLYRALGRFPA